jgi:hypothetical protein
MLEDVGLSDLPLIGPVGGLERLRDDQQSWARTRAFLDTTHQTDGTSTDS